MRFYVDSANVEEIENALSFGYVKGVTTNPTLLKQERIWEKFESVKEFYSEIAKLLNMYVQDGKIFVQIPSTYIPTFLDELRDIFDGLVIKIPSTPAALKNAVKLKEKGYSLCATAVYTSSQALMWSEIGVDYVAIYVNRMKKRGFNIQDNVNSIVKVLNQSSTKVLAASVKDVQELSLVMNVGIQHVTLGYEMIKDITKCDFSVEDTKTFDLDFEEVKKRLGEK